MHHSSSADHVSHDPSLIAGHAAGDLSDTDRVHADALLSSCTPCSDLRRDLVAIAAATRSLPAPAMPARDFRLQPEQAERLRRGSWLRAALRPFAASGSVVRPMATAFTSLGLAGLLVATVLPSLFGSAGSPGTQGLGFEATQASAAPAAPAGTAAGATRQRLVQAGAGSSDDRAGVEGASGSPGYLAVDGKTYGSATDEAVFAAGNDANTEGQRDSAIGATGPAVNPLMAGSLGLLLVGLFLFGLRIAGRRLR
jgi:hypothetical protein